MLGASKTKHRIREQFAHYVSDAPTLKRWLPIVILLILKPPQPDCSLDTGCYATLIDAARQCVTLGSVLQPYPSCRMPGQAAAMDDNRRPAST